MLLSLFQSLWSRRWKWSVQGENQLKRGQQGITRPTVSVSEVEVWVSVSDVVREVEVSVSDVV